MGVDNIKHWDSHCCGLRGCISLRKVAQIIGIAYAFFHLICLCVFTAGVVSPEKCVYWLFELKRDLNKIRRYCVAMTIIKLLVVISSFCLIIGAIKERRSFLLPWLRIMGLATGIHIGVFIARLLLWLDLELLIFDFPVIALNFYCMIKVDSYSDELKERKKPQQKSETQVVA